MGQKSRIQLSKPRKSRRKMGKLYRNSNMKNTSLKHIQTNERVSSLVLFEDGTEALNATFCQTANNSLHQTSSAFSITSNDEKIVALQVSEDTKELTLTAPRRDFDFTEICVKPDIDIEENDIKPTIIPDNPVCNTCHRTLKQNDDLRQEVKRLSLVVEDLKQKLQLAHQKEIRLERTVQSVREIVTADMATTSAK